MPGKPLNLTPTRVTCWFWPPSLWSSERPSRVLQDEACRGWGAGQALGSVSASAGCPVTGDQTLNSPHMGFTLGVPSGPLSGRYQRFMI